MNTIDIARAMIELIDADCPADEMMPELIRRFPSATVADFQRASEIGADQIAMYKERLPEDMAELWEMGAEAIQALVDGASPGEFARKRAEIAAAMARTECSAANIMPRRPTRA
jgi:hypothetical protein